MKKTMTTVMCVLMAFTTTVFAQTQAQDSLREVLLDGVEVMATRANKNTPVAFTNISREELKQRNLGQDLPYLISMTPGAITTSRSERAHV